MVKFLFIKLLKIQEDLLKKKENIEEDLIRAEMDQVLVKMLVNMKVIYQMLNTLKRCVKEYMVMRLIS
jgi:hypothetical protein